MKVLLSFRVRQYCTSLHGCQTICKSEWSRRKRKRILQKRVSALFYRSESYHKKNRRYKMDFL